MKKIKDKKKLYMIFGITVLVVAIIGSTYAYYRYVLTSTSVNTITRGLDYYINYAKGTDITSATLNPSADYTGGNSATVTLNKKDNTYDIYGHIYLDISTIGSNLSNSDALKYTVLEGSTKVSEGKLKGVTSNGSYLLAVNIPLKTTSTTYTVYLWLDESAGSDTSIEGETIKATVRCEATMKEINDEPYTFSFSRKIISLYNVSTKTDVTNNSITYKYDTKNNLMQDVGGNIRYYGASPNNYVYFNCSDYANQSSSTCELWRIIGVFDGKVKLVRDTSIGSYSWDNKDTTTGAENNNGKNDWTDSRLMKLLNPGYDSETVGGSLYYNAKSGTCYVGKNNATVACNFTSIGIKNSATRNLIQEVVYNIGGWDTPAVYSDFIYEKERGTTVYSGRPTTWTGKIGLMYPSDYGYAADFTKCKDASGNDLTIYNYASNVNDYQCRKNNYLYKNKSEWLLIPSSGSSYSVWDVDSPSYVNSGAYVSNGGAIRPVVFLSSTQDIAGGEGTENNPYQLLVD